MQFTAHQLSHGRSTDSPWKGDQSFLEWTAFSLKANDPPGHLGAPKSWEGRPFPEKADGEEQEEGI